MNGEIKEKELNYLLNELKDNSLDYVGTNGCKYQDLTREEINLLLDCITNLQEELDYQRQAEIEYNEKHTKLMNKYKNLQNENERLAKENKNLSVVKKQAVKYIKFTSNLKYKNKYMGLFIKDVCNNLLNILEGDNK